MSGSLKQVDIVRHTGLPKSTVHSILSNYNKYGRIGNSPERATAKRRSCEALNEGDVDVSEFL
jgi:hypothetical protein